MPLFLSTEKRLAKIEHEITVSRETLAQIKADIAASTKARGLIAKNRELEEQNSLLTIQRDQKMEEFARKEREVRHEVGLLRKQVEADRKTAVKEAELKVREANLDHEKNAFKRSMDDAQRRNDELVASLRGLLEQAFGKLPNTNINLGARLAIEPGDD